MDEKSRFVGISILFLILVVAVPVVYLRFSYHKSRPHMPTVSIGQVDVNYLNASSNFSQVIIDFKTYLTINNTADDATVSYSNLVIVAFYQGWPVCGNDRTTVNNDDRNLAKWYPYLVGNESDFPAESGWVTVPHDIVTSFWNDVTMEEVMYVDVRLTGVVKWKRGIWHGKFYLNVTCPLKFPLSQGAPQYLVPPGYRLFMMEPTCKGA